MDNFFIATKIDWTTWLATAARVLLIILIARLAVLGVQKGVAHFKTKFVERKRRASPGAAQRAETVVGMVTQAMLLFIWAITAVVALDEIGVDIRPILAGAGVVGLAIGFGAQNLVRDFLAGIFIILENQISIGDHATINGKGGIVEAINFRTTVLRDLDGTVHVFPNGEIKTLSNSTHGWSAAVLDIGVAYDSDIDKVEEVLKQVGAEMRQDELWKEVVIDELELMGLNELADSSMVIRVRLRTLPLQQWGTGREYRKRVKKAFDRAGITIPFPQLTMHMVSDGDGRKKKEPSAARN